MGTVETGQSGNHGGRPQPAPAPRAAEFVACFERSYRLLWLIAVGIVGEASLAEDVTQEAALIALGKLDQFQPGTSFNAWMGQIVRFVALNMARKDRHHAARSLDAALAPEPAAAAATRDAERSTLDFTRRGTLPENQDWFDDEMLAALQTLGGEARACLLLRTVEGLDYEEIARVLAMPANTAMSHVHRARQALRATLAHRQPARPAGEGGAP